MLGKTKILLVASITLAIALSLGWAGFKVGQWSAASDFSEQRDVLRNDAARLNAEVAELRLAVEKQNSAVRVMEAQVAGAADGKRKAEEFAQSLAKLSVARIDRLTKALDQLEDSDAVLSRYWEIRTQ